MPAGPRGQASPLLSPPSLLREQWIRAKYERREFTDPERQEPYSAGKAGASALPPACLSVSVSVSVSVSSSPSCRIIMNLGDWLTGLNMCPAAWPADTELGGPVSVP